MQPDQNTVQPSANGLSPLPPLPPLTGNDQSGQVQAPQSNNDSAQTQPSTVSSDLLQQLQQVTQTELSNRPDQPTPFTNGNPQSFQSQPQPAEATGVETTPAAPAVAPGEDPLAKLVGLVKDDAGAIDQVKVKKLFVVVKNKLGNEMLRLLVESSRENGIEPDKIIALLLEVDRKVESGELTEDFFLSFTENK